MIKMDLLKIKPKVMKLTEDFENSGLDEIIDEHVHTGSFEGTLKIKGKDVYIFARIYDSKKVTADVQLYLDINPTKEKEYQTLDKELRKWKKDYQKRLSDEITNAIGIKIQPILSERMISDYPPVITFRGNNAADLIKQAKKTAEKLIDAGYQLSNRFFREIYIREG
jgi:hypothetical protein